MDNVEYYIDEDTDTLYRYVVIQEFDDHKLFRREEVIDKDAFILCFNAWLKKGDAT